MNDLEKFLDLDKPRRNLGALDELHFLVVNLDIELCLCEVSVSSLIEDAYFRP